MTCQGLPDCLLLLVIVIVVMMVVVVDYHPYYHSHHHYNGGQVEETQWWWGEGDLHDGRSRFSTSWLFSITTHVLYVVLLLVR